VVEQQYWIIGHAGTDEGGRPHPAERVISVPWWPEAMKYTHEEGNERVDAPILFTSEEAAEVQLRKTKEAEPDSYLKLVNQHGEQHVNQAYDNTAPLTVLVIDREALADKLGDSDFLCVVVGGRMMLRQDFIEELSSDA
jgi:hypothetical protein